MKPQLSTPSSSSSPWEVQVQGVIHQLQQISESHLSQTKKLNETIQKLEMEKNHLRSRLTEEINRKKKLEAEQEKKLEEKLEIEKRKWKTEKEALEQRLNDTQKRLQKYKEVNNLFNNENKSLRKEKKQMEDKLAERLSEVNSLLGTQMELRNENMMAEAILKKKEVELADLHHKVASEAKKNAATNKSLEMMKIALMGEEGGFKMEHEEFLNAVENVIKSEERDSLELNSNTELLKWINRAKQLFDELNNAKAEKLKIEERFEQESKMSEDITTQLKRQMENKCQEILRLKGEISDVRGEYHVKVGELIKVGKERDELLKANNNLEDLRQCNEECKLIIDEQKMEVEDLKKQRSCLRKKLAVATKANEKTMQTQSRHGIGNTATNEQEEERERDATHNRKRYQLSESRIIAKFPRRDEEEYLPNFQVTISGAASADKSQRFT